MDTAQWPQGIGVVKTLDGSRSVVADQRRARPQKDQALNCPRCSSTNTKFCYYNNYSLSQPRYFCKTCRRYWTEGGSLRNVPVGGGSRKNKRSSSSTSSISTSSPINSSKNKLLHDLVMTPPTSFPLQSASQNPKIHEDQDLNLAYPPTDHQDYNNFSKFIELPYTSDNKNHHHPNPNPSSTTTSSSHFSNMELLKADSIASRGLSPFMQMTVSDSNNTIYSSGFPMQEFKTTLNFSLDGFDQSGYGSSLQGVQQNNGNSSARLLFPFEDLKQVSSTSEFEQNRGQGDSSGYWNGMLGGGSW